MRVLITGGAGMLGGDVATHFGQAGHEVVAPTRAELDVCDLDAWRAALSSHRPQLVFHAAAHTDADEGERHPEIPYRVNVVGSWNAALAASEHGATLALVSSCGIFDGAKQAAYSEIDEPNPLTHHHRSKWKAEQAVREVLPRSYVFRPGWLFGGSARHRKNFVEQRRREAMGRARLESARDRFGSPTYTVDFARATLDIIERSMPGTYHVVNAGVASRFEYVRACVRALDLPVEVVPVESDRFPRAAPVPGWEALDPMMMRLRGLALLRPWGDALVDYVRSRLIPEIAATSA